ncbi:MAG TPA: endonuclease/exonuclease/phosphatase family protein [Flavobacteriaceae bacterium]|nr:endonuclease/exonuclease/phosphatase family protein [Flavobacteriaceae bacterium]HEX5743379.1 endonuclease/exonuclease/phosphatase family protein [Flavobacteriaceae bacterium]
MIKKSFFLLFGFLIFSYTYGQKTEKNYQIRTIAFYNLENLFDTINDPLINDDEFTPNGTNRYTSEVYKDKLEKLARVLSEIGSDQSKNSPVIIGVCELENRNVLEDLVKTGKLKDKRWGIVHYDSKDSRGIDVALLYQEHYFKPINHKSFQLQLYDEGKRYYTRDQLMVSGYLDGELIHFIVNHWPSRKGGEVASRPSREKAAALNIEIMSEIRRNDPSAKIISMGDLNDDPINSSLKNILKTESNPKKVEEGSIYNPFEEMFKKGLNTLGYRDNINLFDQIFFTSTLVTNNKDFSSYRFFRAGIYNPSYIINREGQYKGYPMRSYSFNTYAGGYSDHFPVYIHLIRAQK